MKVCFKCGEGRPLSEFYKHQKMADGHLNKCIQCTKLDVKQRRRENPNVQAYDRARGPRQSASYHRKYRADNPAKYKAHCAVNNAVRDGRLLKRENCETCDSNFAVEAHHDDYGRPLEVRWLCSLCHKRWHAEHGEAKLPF